MKPESRILKQSLWQVTILMVLACFLALSVNFFRPHGIPLVGDGSKNTRFSDDQANSLLISLEEARQLFERNSVLFLDARPRDLYLQGHIRGALSMPFQDLDAYFMERADQLNSGKNLVTYCDGETCELSHDLALFLKDSGFNTTQVLVNGWTLWREAGLPTETGEESHEENSTNREARSHQK
jgi:rhodanese-related sulfurtransferase